MQDFIYFMLVLLLVVVLCAWLAAFCIAPFALLKLFTAVLM